MAPLLLYHTALSLFLKPKFKIKNNHKELSTLLIQLLFIISKYITEIARHTYSGYLQTIIKCEGKKIKKIVCLKKANNFVIRIILTYTYHFYISIVI